MSMPTVKLEGPGASVLKEGVGPIGSMLAKATWCKTVAEEVSWSLDGNPSCIPPVVVNCWFCDGVEALTESQEDLKANVFCSQCTCQQHKKAQHRRACSHISLCFS